MTPSRPSPFSDFVTALAETGEIDAELFDATYRALKAALVSELKKKGLWNTPPSYLGIYGWPSWSERAEHRQQTREALDELLPECYHFVFIRRLRSLRAQLEVKGNIDGLVFLGIRNFLHDTQRKHDPLGFRVFELVRTAIRQLIDEDLLFASSGGRKIGNETVLAFARVRAAADDVDLSALIAPTWSDDLLPDLLTAQGRDLDAVLERLGAHLLDLRSRGIEAFRLKHLLEPLKNDIRARWGALFGEAQGSRAFEDGDAEFSNLVPLTQPDLTVEERDSFFKLFAAIAEAIEGLELDEKSKQYLRTLWGFMRTHAAEPEAVPPGSSGRRADALPSQRQLARSLRIPRDRLPGLFEILRRLIRDHLGSQ